MSAVRGHGPNLAVAVLSSTFGTALLTLTGLLAAVVSGGRDVQAGSTLGVVLTCLALVFIVIAVYAGAVVTTNTVSVVVAGRVREIALRRLLGATARSERRAIAREGLAVGAIGAAVGLVVGPGLVIALVGLMEAVHAVPALPDPPLQPVLLVPAVSVALTTWLAATIGSRRVLDVTPMQALGRAEEPSAEDVAGRARTVLAIGAVVVGAALLAAGVAIGLVTPVGVLVGLVGGVVSFTGFVGGAHLVLPRALRLVGRLLGRGPVARVAAANAVRYPVRATRSTVGLVVAVTLVTTFGVAVRTFRDILVAGTTPADTAAVDAQLSVITAVFGALIGFSAVIAAVGLVNALSLGVLQRTRELGLLRALGFQAGQIRRTVAAEAVQLVVTALVVGLVLGTVYGWAGAQAAFGSLGSGGIVLPGIPWGLVGAEVVAAAAVTLVASLAPARRAVTVRPALALVAD